MIPKREQIALNHDGFVVSEVKDRVIKSIDLTRKASEPYNLAGVVSCEDNVGKLDDQVLYSVADEAEEPLLLSLSTRYVEGLKDSIRSAFVKGFVRSKITSRLQDITVFFESLHDGTSSEATAVNACIAKEYCCCASVGTNFVFNKCHGGLLVN